MTRKLIAVVNPWPTRAAEYPRFLAEHPNLAACRDADPDLFSWEEFRTGKRKKRWLEAKAFCDRCPLAADCLKYGKDTEQHGTYGGVMLSAGREVNA